MRRPLFLFLLFIPAGLCCLCHVIPNYQCPPPPHCCESGQYTFDECGCCLTCAKSELQECGGPSGSKGRCAKGLACLKTCEACTTVGSNPEPCVFPFKYGGQTFNRCTSTDAAAGSVWCATQVDKNGEVIEGKWGDCNLGCPGARRECDDLRFSIIIGSCINPAVPGAIPNWLGAPSYRLMKPTKELFSAPSCRRPESKKKIRYQNSCRCATGKDALEISKDGNVRGNCTGHDADKTDNISSIWCFLENVRDPANPKSGCFPDTKWSRTDGRFWSARACQGLPPLDIEEDKSVSLGRKHPLFQAAIKTPFKKPEAVFDKISQQTSEESIDLDTTTKTTPRAVEVYDEGLDSTSETSFLLPIINSRVQSQDETNEEVLPTPLPRRQTKIEIFSESDDPPAIPTTSRLAATEAWATTESAIDINETIIDTNETTIETNDTAITTDEAAFDSAITTDSGSDTIELTTATTTTTTTTTSTTNLNQNVSTILASTTATAITTPTKITTTTTSTTATTTTTTSTTSVKTTTKSYIDTENHRSSGLKVIEPSDISNNLLSREDAEDISIVFPINVDSYEVASNDALLENRTVDLGIFGSFWLQPSKPLQEKENDRTGRPEPVFRPAEHA